MAGVETGCCDVSSWLLTCDQFDRLVCAVHGFVPLAARTAGACFDPPLGASKSGLGWCRIDRLGLRNIQRH